MMTTLRRLPVVKVVCALLLIFAIHQKGLLSPGAESSITAFAFNAVVNQYATGHFDRTIRIWDAATNQLLHTVQGSDLKQRPPSESFTITRAVFNPTGDRLAVSYGGTAAGGLIQIIDTNAAQTRLEIFTGVYTRAIDWSPDGQQLAGMRVYYPETNPVTFLTLWDANTGEVLNEYEMHQTAPLSLDWHPTEAELAFTTGEDVIVWDVANWQPVSTLSAHKGGATWVEWSPDGKELASTGVDGLVRVWDVEKGEASTTIQTNNVSDLFPRVHWRPDSTAVGVIYENHLEVLDITGQVSAQGALSRDLATPIVDFAWEPGGTILLAPQHIEANETPVIDLSLADLSEEAPK